ncbi:DNA-directed RNA polymerase subunit beta', partial [candidate division KSB1 bacterium]
DGDQMAVHVPLSYEAQLETRILMLAPHNILSPANGRPISVPSQDIVLGCYYLTKVKSGEVGEDKLFANQKEVLYAYDTGKVGLHAGITLKIDGKVVKTTVGRVIFNQIMPEEMNFVNELLTKSKIEDIVAQSFRSLGNKITSEFLDRLKELGFYYAMKGGVSIGIDDVIIPDEKENLIKYAVGEVETIQKQYEQGNITDGERYNKIIDVWTYTTLDVSKALFAKLSTSQGGFNPVFMMADSGARGSKEQIRQLAGMRGLMAKPQKSMIGQTGEIIESPITANFKEGLSVLEYFISTHGARKGLADTALKTADAGYLTRRLVDVAQDVIITQDDCGTIMGLEISDLKEGEEIIEPLYERILGRIAVEDVYDPQTEEMITESGQEIDEAASKRIADSILDTVSIRSVLTCESKFGVCRMCYGRNLATGKVVSIGEAVGVMAAQSIGEPGTQLTLRTFHIGGTAQVGAAQSGVKAKNAGKIEYSSNLKFTNTLDGTDEKIKTALGRNGRIEITDDNNRMVARYSVPYGASILVDNGADVQKGQMIFQWDPYSLVILSEFAGTVKFADLKEGVTYNVELDEHTGLKQRVVVESRNRKINPHILVLDENEEKIANYMIPVKSRLMVDDGQEVEPGKILVKIPRGTLKSKDITGGLPRVAELFEARKPKEPAVVTEIDGNVKFGSIKRGIREITIQGKSTKKSYLIPYGKHILVHDGDEVMAGERLSEGSVAPHDILRIKGANAVQEYLVNEIQEVYRLQGVKINDKHIETIVRQMLQRVRIEDPGDTYFLEDDLVDKSKFLSDNEKILNYGIVDEPGGSKLNISEMVEIFELDRLNERLKNQEKDPIKYRQARPATFIPQLLGITQASLSTESFISSASFQETTRVLTEAAIEGKIDNLRGLKENVIIGHLIPAGTGIKTLQNIEIISDNDIEEEKLLESEVVADSTEETVEENQSVEG